MIELDLRATYFHIPALQAHRCYLWFTVGQEHFQVAVLPFGLTTFSTGHQSADLG